MSPVSTVTAGLCQCQLTGRSVYRADELLTFDGGSGGSYSDQKLFIGMDASLMVCAISGPSLKRLTRSCSSPSLTSSITPVSSTADGCSSPSLPRNQGTAFSTLTRLSAYLKKICCVRSTRDVKPMDCPLIE